MARRHLLVGVLADSCPTLYDLGAYPSPCDSAAALMNRKLTAVASDWPPSAHQHSEAECPRVHVRGQPALLDPYGHIHLAEGHLRHTRFRRFRG